MVEEVVHRLIFRYPVDMPEGDKRNITIKSGYRASASLKAQHKVVYRNLLKKNTLAGEKNTTGRSMPELNKKYPERYKELRVEFQKSMVQEWRGLVNREEREREVDNEPLVRVVEDLGYCDPLIEGPEVRKGFLARLFRRS